MSPSLIKLFVIAACFAPLSAHAVSPAAANVINYVNHCGQTFYTQPLGASGAPWSGGPGNAVPLTHLIATSADDQATGDYMGFSDASTQTYFSCPSGKKCKVIARDILCTANAECKIQPVACGDATHWQSATCTATAAYAAARAGGYSEATSASDVWVCSVEVGETWTGSSGTTVSLGFRLGNAVSAMAHEWMLVE